MMHTVLTLLGAAALARAVTIPIEAGAFYFKPEYILANPGDVLEFHFTAKNHSVVQGRFDAPCQPAENGFYSGYFPVDSGENAQVFRVTVQNTNPMWFYCGNNNRNHCKEGMVGVVNAPLDVTLAKYKLASQQYSGQAGEPPRPTGGQVAMNPGPISPNNQIAPNTGGGSTGPLPLVPTDGQQGGSSSMTMPLGGTGAPVPVGPVVNGAQVTNAGSILALVGVGLVALAVALGF